MKTESWDVQRRHLTAIANGKDQWIDTDGRAALQECLRRVDRDHIEPGIGVKEDLEALRAAADVERGQNVLTGATACIATLKVALARAQQPDALIAALQECAEWLESRPDATEGDAATSSRARAVLAAHRDRGRREAGEAGGDVDDAG